MSSLLQEQFTTKTNNRAIASIEQKTWGNKVDRALLVVPEQYVSSEDIKQIAKQLKKWSKKLKAFEQGVGSDEQTNT